MTTPALISGPGYVTPVQTNGELNDVLLAQFLQQLVVGLTSMTGTLVFPRWQLNPPNQPDATQDWAAIGCLKRPRDVFAAVIHSTDLNDFFNSTDMVYRNQILEILCSFYGPNAEKNSELFAMGLSLAQNREAMRLNGFGLVEVGESLIVPALIKEQWIMGIDVSFRLRRQQAYQYPVPNLKGAQGTIQEGQTTEKIAAIPGYGEFEYADLPFSI